jgi:arylsulfatase A-like enzyme
VSAAAPQPNIVFLLNDHQAYYGHGAMAGGPPIRRPHFDRLAGAGVTFDRAYCAAPLCGPDRRSLLTGLFPHNHGEIYNDYDHPFDRETYLDVLAAGGYRNYYYGKWHAGPGTAYDHRCEGFSIPSYNNPYTKPEYRAYLERMGLPPPQIRIQHSFHNWGEMRHRLAESVRTGKPYIQDGPWCNEHASGILLGPKETHESFFLAHLAREKLRELAKRKDGRPFHLRVDFWGPHQPYFVTQEFADLYDPEAIPEYPSFRDDLDGKPDVYRRDSNLGISRDRRLIQPNPVPWKVWRETMALAYAQSTLVDAAGGLVLDALEELGLAENTLVLWTTDHGDGLACHGGHYDKDAYLPEEMIRVPFAMRWPGRIPGGVAGRALVSHVDVAPTFLAAAGLSFRQGCDGTDLLPAARDPQAPGRDDLMVEHHGHSSKCVGRVLLHGRYKYVRNEGDLDELYDLHDDPYELRNLAADARFAATRADMARRLATWQERTGDRPDDPDSPWQQFLRRTTRATS